MPSFRPWLVVAAAALPAFSGAAAADGADVPPALTLRAGEALPRNLTDAERKYLQSHPLATPRGAAVSPTGPIFCPPEYAPMEGILFAWEGTASWNTIQQQMIAQITTTGNAIAYVVVDTTSERTSVQSTLSSAGINLNRVQFIVRTTDTIWIRDYGPRYIYEGDCRAIIDHVYNRPRPNDDVFPQYFATVKHHAIYEIPLVHGGGNFHLDALGNSFATRLVDNENPSLTESAIVGLWQSFQNVNTTLLTPFPTNIDSTQHLDMWMEIIGDHAVVISDWPNNPGSTQDVICDDAALMMASRGYTVYRVPAFSVGGVHYTYTNVVLCNDLVLIPSYTNGAVSPSNATALATWQAAMPGKAVVQINCEAIVSAAGVMHCIVMHVPTPRGGANPTTYVETLNDGPTLTPGAGADIRWISDDDVGVSNVDILLSLDGGATYPVTIASAAPDSGQFTWTVPDTFTHHGRIRVLARDGDGNTGGDATDLDFTIAGGCPADLNGDGAVSSADLALLLGAWGPGASPADLNGDGVVGSGDLAEMLGAWGACP